MYSLTSSKESIVRFVEDFNIPESAYNVPTLVRWMGDAIEYIGATLEFSRNTVEAVVENYRWAVPCDLLEVESVVHEGCALIECGATTTPRLLDRPQGNAAVTKSLFETNADSPASFSDSIQTYKTVRNHRKQQADCYVFNNSYLNTSIESGKLAVTGSFILTDDDGFPLIPNNVEYKDALKHYMLYRMMATGYKHSVMTYQEANRLWVNSCAEAGNLALLPSPDEAERIRRTWSRLIPRIDPHLNLFDDV